MKKRLTRKVTTSEVMVYGMFLTTFILSQFESSFGAQAGEYVYAFLGSLMAVSLSLLVLSLIGLVIMAKLPPERFFSAIDFLENISYFKKVPKWWYIGFMREKHIRKIITKINKRAFIGDMVIDFPIKSSFFKKQEIKVFKENTLTTITKGECYYSLSLRKVRSINVYGWWGEEEFTRTICHEMAHAYQVIKTGESDHGPVFESIYKHICQAMQIRPVFDYMKDEGWIFRA